MSAIEAGPDGDVFSFAVLMLYVFFQAELRENNMFAHSVRAIYCSGKSAPCCCCYCCCCSLELYSARKQLKTLGVTGST